MTHAGRRPTNEDAFLAAEELGLFVVADGMGGHNAGEVASDLAVQTIRDVVQAEGGVGVDVLGLAVRTANDTVLSAAGRQQDHAGMGTTVVAVLLADECVFYTGVGDSRLYHLRGSALVQLTRDDTWVSHVLSNGSDDATRDHPMRHVLTKVVGLQPDLDVSVGRVDFGAGDILLLCSDGLHGALQNGNIADALGHGGTPKEMAEELVAAALASGATDNVTAVVVQRLA
jgi:serine/threonine protein phosphatase PrpC